MCGGAGLAADAALAGSSPPPWQARDARQLLALLWRALEQAEQYESDSDDTLVLGQ